MNEDIQGTLDNIEQLMQNALHQTASRPSGTRVLQVLVTMLARQCLTPEQQKQVETIQEVFEECVSRNGEIKHWSVTSTVTHALPEVHKRGGGPERFLREMTDQEVRDRYIQEMLTLKQGLAALRRGERPKKYANTLMMNQCSRALKLRGLPIPVVKLPENEGTE